MSKIKFLERHRIGEYLFVVRDRKIALYVSNNSGYNELSVIYYQTIEMGTASASITNDEIQQMVKLIPREQYIKDILDGHKVALYIREKGLK